MQANDDSTENASGPADHEQLAAQYADTHQPWQDADVLEELYHGHELTTREIASVLGCTNGTVSRWLNTNDIPTRDNWRAGVEAAKWANRVERVTMRTLPSGYEYWSDKNDDVNRIVYVHRLLAVAEYGMAALKDNHVHHPNGIQWDNRPDNIELMNPSDHGRMHANQRWESEKA